MKAVARRMVANTSARLARGVAAEAGSARAAAMPARMTRRVVCIWASHCSYRHHDTGVRRSNQGRDGREGLADPAAEATRTATVVTLHTPLHPADLFEPMRAA